MTTGNDIEVSPSQFRGVTEKIGDLKRDAGLGIAFEFDVQATAIFVPIQSFLTGSGDGIRWGDDTVAVIKLLLDTMRMLFWLND